MLEAKKCLRTQNLLGTKIPLQPKFMTFMETSTSLRPFMPHSSNSNSQLNLITFIHFLSSERSITFPIPTLPLFGGSSNFWNIHYNFKNNQSKIPQLLFKNNRMKSMNKKLLFPSVMHHFLMGTQHPLAPTYFPTCLASDRP